MDNNIGVILIDGNEILLQIFTLEKQQWVQFSSQTYDLASNRKWKSAKSSQIIEIIAGVFLKKYAAAVDDWKICGRNIEEEVIADISDATGFHIELLTLKKDQDLLCKGILMDME